VIVGKLGKQDFTVSCGVVDDIISTCRADKINNCGISGAKWVIFRTSFKRQLNFFVALTRFSLKYTIYDNYNYKCRLMENNGKVLLAVLKKVAT
jgi:hypothetical protein